MNMNSSLGIISGYGLLPEIFVNEVKNINFYVVGFNKYFNKKVLKYAVKFKILNSWSLSEIINFFKENNVKKIVFLGYVPHNTLLEKNLQMDDKAKDIFNRLKKKSAMEIFNGLLEEFKNFGIQVEPINKYLTSSFAEKGEINNLKLTSEEIENVEFGYNIAKEIARLDIGLTVVVKNKIVVAVEGLEGTDNCILRGGRIAGEGCYVIKVARPNQDMRFDLPVIGPKTVKILNSVKAKILAVESGKTLILNKQEVIEKTKRLGIKFYGV